MEARITRCCDHCRAELEDDALFCPACGYPVDLWRDAKKQKSKIVGLRKKGWIKKASITGWKRTAISITAVVLLFALAGILVSSYFAVLGGPLQRMTAAINHTIHAESFTVDTRYEQDNWKLYQSWNVQYDLKDEEFLLWTTRTLNDNTYRMAICDGYEAYQWDNGEYSVENVQRDINLLFDMYRESQKLSFRKTNWQNVLDGFDRDIYRDITRLVDMEQAERDVQVLRKCMNNTKWMKENAGYSCKWKNGVMTHTMHIDPYRFLMACLECFEDSFYSRSDYYAMQDTIEEAFWDEERIDISFTVKNGKICDVTYMDGYYDMQTFTLRGVGHTVVDEDAIRTFCDKARRS